MSMSEIPAAIPAAAAGAFIRAQQAASAADAERSARAEAADRTARAVGEHAAVVDTDDADTRVFTDAEGHGSQGRPFDEPPEEPAAESPPPKPGITTSPDGAIHIDIEA